MKKTFFVLLTTFLFGYNSNAQTNNMRYKKTGNSLAQRQPKKCIMPFTSWIKTTQR